MLLKWLYYSCSSHRQLSSFLLMQTASGLMERSAKCWFQHFWGGEEASSHLTECITTAQMQSFDYTCKISIQEKRMGDARCYRSYINQTHWTCDWVSMDDFYTFIVKNCSKQNEPMMMMMWQTLWSNACLLFIGYSSIYTHTQSDAWMCKLQRGAAIGQPAAQLTPETPCKRWKTQSTITTQGEGGKEGEHRDWDDWHQRKSKSPQTSWRLMAFNQQTGRGWRVGVRGACELLPPPLQVCAQVFVHRMIYLKVLSSHTRGGITLPKMLKTEGIK